MGVPYEDETDPDAFVSNESDHRRRIHVGKRSVRTTLRAKQGQFHRQAVRNTPSLPTFNFREPTNAE
jgi:hypothetical protein